MKHSDRFVAEMIWLRGLRITVSYLVSSGVVEDDAIKWAHRILHLLAHKRHPLQDFSNDMEMEEEEALCHNEIELWYVVSGENADMSESRACLKEFAYRYTRCGIRTEFKDGEIVIGSTVEDSDGGTMSVCLSWPFTYTAYHKALDGIEKDAIDTWRKLHPLDRDSY